jgi:hypothetical protein
MKIVIGIPTGQRAEQAVEVVKAWQERGIEVCIFTWEDETRAMVSNRCNPSRIVKTKRRESFAILQNRMMKYAPDWDIWICGADDLWPGDQEDLKERIELIASESRDGLIWVADGCCNEQPTHPIITRKMYEALDGDIFDENYKHNYVDTDLFMRMLERNRVLKCFDITLDHRHPIKTGGEVDEIYNIGAKSFSEDAEYYLKKWQGAFINHEFIEELEIE